MLESTFKTKLIKELMILFPEAIIIHLDPTETQGMPDILILYKTMWASLEGKQNKNSTRQPNQDYYVELMNDMSFSAFIYPENKKEVLDALQRAFRIKR